MALGDGDGRPWQVGLRDPFGGVLGGVELAGGEALFSTGNYSKFRDSPSGARWSHILDPRTGQPARGAAAVVVLHTDPLLADAGATALFVAGPAGFERLARRMGLACAMMVTEKTKCWSPWPCADGLKCCATRCHWGRRWTSARTACCPRARPA